MKDSKGRKIDYLRISVTDRCNFRCKYCMPAEGVEPLEHNQILSFEEILRLTRILAKKGISKIKITGGEPLVRLGVIGLIKDIKAISGIKQVTVTTNAMLLEKFAEDLLEAGVDGINVSLDTMNKETFKEITLVDGFDQVICGIEKALELGMKIKLNFVPIKGVNQEDITKIALWAKDREISVRYIELMPMGYGTQFTMLKGDVIKEILEKEFGKLTAFEEKLGNGPASYYSLEGFVGKIGFIEALSHEFCEDCNRLRLTSDGCLKPCLFSNIDFCLKEMLEESQEDEEIALIIDHILKIKPEKHNFETEKKQGDQESREMFRIGG